MQLILDRRYFICLFLFIFINSNVCDEDVEEEVKPEIPDDSLPKIELEKEFNEPLDEKETIRSLEGETYTIQNESQMETVAENDDSEKVEAQIEKNIEEMKIHEEITPLANKSKQESKILTENNEEKINVNEETDKESDEQASLLTPVYNEDETGNEEEISEKQPEEQPIVINDKSSEQSSLVTPDNKNKDLDKEQFPMNVNKQYQNEQTGKEKVTDGKNLQKEQPLIIKDKSDGQSSLETSVSNDNENKDLQNPKNSYTSVTTQNIKIENQNEQTENEEVIDFKNQQKEQPTIIKDINNGQSALVTSVNNDNENKDLQYPKNVNEYEPAISSYTSVTTQNIKIENQNEQTVINPIYNEEENNKDTSIKREITNVDESELKANSNAETTNQESQDLAKDVKIEKHVDNTEGKKSIVELSQVQRQSSQDSLLRSKFKQKSGTTNVNEKEILSNGQVKNDEIGNEQDMRDTDTAIKKIISNGQVENDEIGNEQDMTDTDTAISRILSNGQIETDEIGNEEDMIDTDTAIKKMFSNGQVENDEIGKDEDIIDTDTAIKKMFSNGQVENDEIGKNEDMTDIDTAIKKIFSNVQVANDEIGKNEDMTDIDTALKKIFSNVQVANDETENNEDKTDTGTAIKNIFSNVQVGNDEIGNDEDLIDTDTAIRKIFLNVQVESDEMGNEDHITDTNTFIKEIFLSTIRDQNKYTKQNVISGKQLKHAKKEIKNKKSMSTIQVEQPYAEEIITKSSFEKPSNTQVEAPADTKTHFVKKIKSHSARPVPKENISINNNLKEALVEEISKERTYSSINNKNDNKISKNKNDKKDTLSVNAQDNLFHKRKLKSSEKNSPDSVRYKNNIQDLPFPRTQKQKTEKLPPLMKSLGKRYDTKYSSKSKEHSFNKKSEIVMTPRHIQPVKSPNKILKPSKRTKRENCDEVLIKNEKDFNTNKIPLKQSISNKLGLHYDLKDIEHEIKTIQKQLHSYDFWIQSVQKQFRLPTDDDQKWKNKLKVRKQVIQLVSEVEKQTMFKIHEVVNSLKPKLILLKNKLTVVYNVHDDFKCDLIKIEKMLKKFADVFVKNFSHRLTKNLEKENYKQEILKQQNKIENLEHSFKGLLHIVKMNRKAIIVNILEDKISKLEEKIANRGKRFRKSVNHFKNYRLESSKILLSKLPNLIIKLSY